MEKIRKIESLTPDDIGKKLSFVGKLTKKETDKTYQFITNDGTGNLYFIVFKDGNNISADLVKKLNTIHNDVTIRISGEIKDVKKDSKTTNFLKNILDISEVLYVNNEVFDVKEMTSTVNKALRAIKDAEIKKFTKKVILGIGLEKYSEAPFSDRNYYACKHGLLCYTYKMLKVYSAISKLIDCGDRNIILSTILTHRVGKVISYQNDTNLFRETKDMQVLGDGLLSANAIIPYLDVIKDVEKRTYLEHTIFATKRYPSWGALNEAKTKEAYIIHYIEKLVLTEAEFKNLQELYKDEDLITFGSNKSPMLIKKTG